MFAKQNKKTVNIDWMKFDSFDENFDVDRFYKKRWLYAELNDYRVCFKIIDENINFLSKC